MGNGSHFCTTVLISMCNITFQVLRLSTFVFNIFSEKKYSRLYLACGTKSGQILLNRVTDAIILNIYIKYTLTLIENELGHTFELNDTFERVRISGKK